MATIHDLIEVTEISQYTTYSKENGNLLDVIDNVSSSDLNDGEFDTGDDLTIDGVSYNIDSIYEPNSNGSFSLGDGSSKSFAWGLEANLDVVFLTVSNGGDVRHFIIPNDSYGSMNVEAIHTGSLSHVGFNDAAVISTGNNSVGVVCFTRGTLIEVAQGRQVPIETLTCKDRVMTADHGMQQIKWIGATVVEAETLAKYPNLCPIRVAKGALGAGMPQTDLYLSPQHRVLVRSKVAERMFGEQEVLVAIKHLTALDGIEVVKNAGRTEYFHILLEGHEILVASGAPCESLYLGVQALRSVGAQGRHEILHLFPEIVKWADGGAPSRQIALGARGRRLAERHQQNHLCLVDRISITDPALAS
ncbi:hemolysin-type calcium-binding region [Litorivita pollutaquae]|uniref:Hemolysin-type calcium-binding region n=1 Tax=Litorivita pollutaquae TaxID=2200892 RepID=A0A2V4NK06_9RHOB|nr:Hint domain-containing protein [Litorivita pollutaquae]PYC46487.1 hemolysin-type calcium-binding region [Litorivita pollutaquae]